MATPLIRIPQEQGGTMYAFSSAARDLTRAYYNPDLVFEYSKFALLDIPVVAEPAQGSTNNYIQFNKLFDGTQAYDDTTVDNANVHFAQTFQNYALNLENYILTDDDFDQSIYSSDSEKIFFKWLNHLGAFNVRPATSQEVADPYSRAIELDDSTSTGSEYSQVVKYVGNIDVSNDKNFEGEVYNEIFVNVPSSVGYTPEILFKSSNFNTTATSYDPNTGDGKINGRSGQTHPDSNIGLEALSDNANATIDLSSQDLYNYGIEWNSEIYAKIVNDPKLNNFLDYSKRGGDFRFNAILVYYDIHSKSTVANRSTNLYGIIILDNFKDDPGSTGWYIPELTKYKPNEVTGLNGNAFALKLNVKFNSSLDNVGVENNINDFSTFSMDIFLDTTSALESAANLLVEANNRYNDIAKRLESLETLMLTARNQTNLLERVSNLEGEVETAALNYADSSSILDMITSTNSRINQIINGEISTDIQYNTDVLKEGGGILIDKSAKNKIRIVNTNYGYSLNEVFEYDKNSNSINDLNSVNNKFNPQSATTNGLWSRIKAYDNLVRINLDSGELSGDLNIYLDDTINSFKNGQVVKFTFKDDLPNIGSVKINILTRIDYAGKGKGWALRASIDSNTILSQRPYFELICTDEINKTFELEIIR